MKRKIMKVRTCGDGPLHKRKAKAGLPAVPQERVARAKWVPVIWSLEENRKSTKAKVEDRGRKERKESQYF